MDETISVPVPKSDAMRWGLTADYIEYGIAYTKPILVGARMNNHGQKIDVYAIYSWIAEG